MMFYVITFYLEIMTSSQELAKITQNDLGHLSTSLWLFYPIHAQDNMKNIFYTGTMCV